MEAENKKRQEKGKNWEVVYGLAEYSLEVDIEHEMSRLKKNGQIVGSDTKKAELDLVRKIVEKEIRKHVMMK